MKDKRICPICECEFTPSEKRRKYDSWECKFIASGKRYLNYYQEGRAKYKKKIIPKKRLVDKIK
jgi:hypothetical protein